MKYILSIVLLFCGTQSYSLFYCFKKAHEQLKDDKPIAPAKSSLGMDETLFLQQGNNSCQTVTLHLYNRDDHSERTFIREVLNKEFKQTGQWKLEIVTDQTQCLEVNTPTIIPPTTTTQPFQYAWHFSPKKPGNAVVRATYTSSTRKNPFIQEFIVFVENRN
ncbi:hypothetical protein BH09DEP1_BH09DEP1_6100 [soil metagenome]